MLNSYAQGDDDADDQYHHHRVISQETPDTDGDGFEDEDEAMLGSVLVFAQECSPLPGI